MKYANNTERRKILEQARNAVTLKEIEAAVQALRCWKQEHPDDLAIEDAFEPLALMRLAAQETEQSKPEAVSIG